MATWQTFTEQRPDMASAGQTLLYQHGVGLAFLATVRTNGRPRLHPMCPLIADNALFAFIIPSPKQSDLERDGWYAMHSFPCPDNEDAFYLTGRAELIRGPDVRAVLAAQFVAERSQFAVAPPAPEDALFEFGVDTCLHTKTTTHGDPAPHHDVWHAPSK